MWEKIRLKIHFLEEKQRQKTGALDILDAPPDLDDFGKDDVLEQNFDCDFNDILLADDVFLEHSITEDICKGIVEEIFECSFGVVEEREIFCACCESMECILSVIDTMETIKEGVVFEMIANELVEECLTERNLARDEFVRTFRMKKKMDDEKMLMTSANYSKSKIQDEMFSYNSAIDSFRNGLTRNIKKAQNLIFAISSVQDDLEILEKMEAFENAKTEKVMLESIVFSQQGIQ